MPDANVRGDYPVTYTATDASGNMATTVVRNYRVDDYIAPEIDLHTPDTVTHDVGTPYYTTPATVSDNYYSNSSVSLVKTGYVDANILGTYTETYTATDESGNKAVKERYIKVVDRVAPEISADIIKTPVGQGFNNMNGLNIRDNYYPPAALMPLVEIISSNVNIWEPGLYSITYQVTDPSGNRSARFNRIVYVAYDIIGTDNITEVELDASVSVYPVPSSGDITIDVNLEQTTVEATVVNMLGEEVMNLGELQRGANDIDLSNNAAGVYFIRLSSGQSTVMKKIILN